MIDVPQPIADALQTALQARLDLDTAVAAQVVTGTNELAASQANAAAQADVATKTNALTNARQSLEALEDQYLQQGGVLTPPTPPTPPDPTPSPVPPDPIPPGSTATGS